MSYGKTEAGRLRKEKLQSRHLPVQNRRKLIAELTKARAQEIETLAQEWEKSKRITAYLDAIENSEIVQSQRLAKLNRWVRDLAAHYDPLQQVEITSLREHRQEQLTNDALNYIQ